MRLQSRSTSLNSQHPRIVADMSAFMAWRLQPDTHLQVLLALAATTTLALVSSGASHSLFNYFPFSSCFSEVQSYPRVQDGVRLPFHFFSPLTNSY